MAVMCIAVHPRVCGEQVRPGGAGPEYYGSSPRVRGTAGACTQKMVNGRFIPACAGNSRHLLCRKCADTVHPRVCGEQIRSEEHTSELQSLMRISYAVFCLKKKTTKASHSNKNTTTTHLNLI